VVTDDNAAVVPVWTLATRDVEVPHIGADGRMTPQRLAELRTVLAALADAPIATLEVHPLPETLDRTRGIPLGSASPLAQQLSQLVSQTSKAGSAAGVGEAGETLYRMVVPAKVAEQFGKGLVKPMASKAAAGGVHSALTGSSGIAAQATFEPVAKRAAAAGALTVAAPLMFMAVAASVSVYADHQRQQATKHITELLEELHDYNLDSERNALDGCCDSINKATAILLDQGRIGAALGLEPAVYAINVAVAAARRRVEHWQQALAGFGEGRVELAALEKTFADLDKPASEFRTHLELADLAIALKRRVRVLQAVEQAQLNPDNPFENFMRALKDSSQRIDDLESSVNQVLRGLSAIKLDRSRGLRNVMFTGGDVDKLLRVSYRLRELGERVEPDGDSSGLAIEMARNADDSVVVFPTVAA
jgi:hypothetical protein